MTDLHLYNTETRRKEVLRPAKDNELKLYTCGPTVYDFAHIGNFRTYVFEDVLRRTAKFLGMKVNQVMNLTDVDDKTIRGAVKEGISLLEYTERYKRAFFEDLETLRIEKVEAYPAATDFVPQMIDMIQTLITKGNAYTGKDGSIYFSLKSFPNYGRLSHFKLQELQVGASERVATDEYDKENAADFVLWKMWDPERDGNIYWESPFGKGRPGWHLECSTMATEILGETIDLHVGGVDNIFPHHENEIAQSEACTGCQFSRHWTHSEHLIVDGKKMSKSLGNFYTLRGLLAKGFSGVQVRYMMVASHYRTQLNFTFEGLEGAKSSLQRLNGFIQRLGEQTEERVPLDQVTEYMSLTRARFTQAIADDLNTSSALAALFDLSREVNPFIDRELLGKQQAREIVSLLKNLDQVLAVLDFAPATSEVPGEVQEALVKRNAARAAKQWREADTLRDWILARGYVIEDTPHGARVVKSS